jgi:hypothetical protein
VYVRKPAGKRVNLSGAANSDSHQAVSIRAPTRRAAALMRCMAQSNPLDTSVGNSVFLSTRA